MSLREVLIGKPRDPLDPSTRHSIALIAFFAWVGLGADGLSSSCYGPEEAYIALGAHTHFGLYLAVAIAVTVFIISLAYNQVIELFPNGGGGYKVATQLIGAARRTRVGRRADRGLRADHRDLDRGRRGRALQPAARRLPRVEDSLRSRRDRRAARAQPARHEGSDQGAAADLRRRSS